MSLSLTISPFQIAGFVFAGDELTLPANAVTHVGIVKSSLAVATTADGTVLDPNILWVCAATTDDANITLMVHHDLLSQLENGDSGEAVGGVIEEIDSFTAGTSTTITLGTAYTDKDQFMIQFDGASFDGAIQPPSGYSYDSDTQVVTFGSAIPSGVDLILVIPIGAGAASGNAESVVSPLLVSGSAGTSGQCLVSQGPDAPPTWAWVDAVPVGGVVAFGSNSVPVGWLLANGAAVSRSGYADLFAMIGTTYGAGNGTTTFNLPDLRGEFVRGADLGRGVDSARVVGSFQTDLLKAHAHTASSALRVGTATDGNSNICSGGGDAGPVSVTISSTGGAETRPRNVALVYCIKATSASSANAGGGTPTEGDNTLPRKNFSTLTSSSGVLTLDLDATTGMFYHVLTENITSIVVNYVPTLGVTNEAAYFQLVIKQHASAAKTVAFPASFKVMGTGWEMTTTLGDFVIVEGVSYDEGATWLVTFVSEV